ncbi:MULTISPECIES: sugar-binding transcriptional regulator [unclassified Sporosarcina]|uniref:sugar-binding transcriptional regulator n=1 Tax=unclassified Sporosarcina TaxID=2647733 RepID=UPI00203E69E1|nr:MULTISPECIES: sugar-binding domain-containing protein [unclassified Sporosarcina]GKV65528.1 central glycolytic genes regulator [Sporosarcina sp. NCCP-2331]GLB55653.1 central glycolytic genes regulator [Sporosarcina sp. NCCP-2378]
MSLSFIDAQLALVPEISSLIEQRYHLLKLIKLSGPVGRRPLSTMSGCSEREIRTMLESMKEQGTVEIAKEGVSITGKGAEILFILHDSIEERSGRRQLAEQLVERLAVRDVHIVEGNSDRSELTKKLLGMHTAKQFRSLINGHKIVAVTGGSTVASIPAFMHNEELSDLLFIAARGGVGEELGLQANMIAASFAETCDASYKAFYYPDTLSEEAHAVFQHEPAAKEMLELYSQTECVIHGVGNAAEMALLRNSREEEKQILTDRQAEGEAFGFYFNRHGEIVHRIRTVGIQMEQLQEVPLVFAVAGGESKAEALLSYLASAPPQTILITDEGAANKMLSLM